MNEPASPVYDLLVIGGGINGAGVARDAAGRGLKVALVEAGDLGGATSSASTKLIHGGLRYLEFYAFRLVQKALAEREVLLDAAPHITWPQSFVLPNPSGMGAHFRPVWLLRAGLFLYDRLARRKDVPASRRINLRQDAAGRALADRDAPAFRFWDGWIDDARMVIANAQDAAAHGALVRPRTAVVSAQFIDRVWSARLSDGTTLAARYIVNAAGPWAQDVAQRVLACSDAPALKLVQGSHIVTKRVHMGDDAFMLQQPDGRIIFIIPYEREFSLIGTTERTVEAPGSAASPDEIAYLFAGVNRWLARSLVAADMVHSFAGVRPLVLEATKDNRETTRDWHLVHHKGVPALTIVGGKITTYRLLAEDVLHGLGASAGINTRRWTAGAVLPGGDVPRRRGERGQAAFKRWLDQLVAAHQDYDPRLVRRLAHTLGTAAAPMLAAGLGRNIGGMWEAELIHYRDHEWAVCADDVLWRRTKMGLHIGTAGRAAVMDWFGEEREAGFAEAQPETPFTHRFAAPRS